MLKKEGVYTTKCPECARSILIHLAFDGTPSPKECTQCHLNFAGIDNGVERNTFVVVAKESKENKPKVIINEESKKDNKESSRSFEFSKKNDKKSKKSFKW